MSRTDPDDDLSYSRNTTKKYPEDEGELGGVSFSSDNGSRMACHGSLRVLLRTHKQN